MAITVSPYDHTTARFLGGDNPPGDTYLITLYSVLPFIPAATTKAAAEVGATQIPTANGYTQNTKTLSSVATTIVTTNGGMFDADDTVWTPTAGTVEAAFALLCNSTDSGSPPVYHLDFGGIVSATFSPLVPFTITWNASGIALVTVT